MNTVDFDRKSYWDKVYETKQATEVSWYQEKPVTSLEFIRELNLPRSAKIFDSGGGDSFLVDHLLDHGYENITILDISENALRRTQQRLGAKADKIKWIQADEAKCNPAEEFDLWHDRAAFHFLTDENDIANYIRTIKKCIKPGGHLIMGTFSEQGPRKCSGLDVKQYSEATLTELLKNDFQKIKCAKVDHTTPFATVQNFLFCGFRRNGP